MTERTFRDEARRAWPGAAIGGNGRWAVFTQCGTPRAALYATQELALESPLFNPAAGCDPYACTRQRHDLYDLRSGSIVTLPARDPHPYTPRAFIRQQDPDGFEGSTL